MTKYAVVKVGVLADDGRTPTYQIFELRPNGTYDLCTSGPNDPTHEHLAKERVNALNFKNAWNAKVE